MYSRLAIRSTYSLLWGTASPTQIMEELASQGCRAVAITDRDNLYGLHECRATAQIYNMQLIVGTECITTAGSIFVFVETPLGYSRLCTILSQKKQQKDFNTIAALTEHAEGLLLATTVPTLLNQLAGRVPTLYAAVSPTWFGAIPTAQQLGLPLLAIDNATHLTVEDFNLHAVLRAIACRKTVGTLTQAEQEDQNSLLLSATAYGKALSAWPEALENTEHVAKTCAKLSLFETLIFPDYPVENSDAPTELRLRVLRGAEKRYGEVSDAILGRIEYELDIINHKGFAPYFLVMDDIVAMASRTCGRGSGAASIVAYALGITQVDPIAHNLYFERFLTMARTDPPDIDVDFAWDERDDILHEVITRFGKKHCARVANHNRFRIRSAIRETAMAYGLPGSGTPDSNDPLWATIYKVASRLEGMPRGLSMHCGGVVITPRPIAQYAPVETSNEGYPLLAWEKEGTETAGLVKIDLLGNRSLAVIRDVLDNLREQGIYIDERTWRPTEDEETMQALANGDTMGVFYIESPAMRQLQKKTQRGDFTHITIHSSIIRPAANKFIDLYIRRLKGEPWEPLHPRLAKILDETYGILCYQEDVSKTAVVLAGFSEADADALRKVIAKKAGSNQLTQYEEQFVTGCKENGIDEHTIATIWEMMLSFEGYSFCKPHSASYAMVSFQSAYLRVHYPAAFMAAVLANQGGYYHPQAYISEIRRMGLLLIGPDINQSRYRYYAQNNRVIVGFMAIANLSTATSNAIINERGQNGSFTCLEELPVRVKIHRDDLVALVSAGACDSLAPSIPRSEQLRRLLTTPSRKDQNEKQGELFTSKQSHTTTDLFCTPIRRTEAELQREFETLGFLKNHHPLLLWARKIAPIKRIRAINIDRYINRYVQLVGWPITRKTIWTMQNLAMEFISFEDETALYETVVFPHIYTKYHHMVCGKQPVLVKGRVCNDHGAVQVEVQSFQLIKKT